MLMDSSIPTNILSCKLNEFDCMDTHDTFRNYIGFRYQMVESSKILF